MVCFIPFPMKLRFAALAAILLEQPVCGLLCVREGFSVLHNDRFKSSQVNFITLKSFCWKWIQKGNLMGTSLTSEKLQLKKNHGGMKASRAKFITSDELISHVAPTWTAVFLWNWTHLCSHKTKMRIFVSCSSCIDWPTCCPALFSLVTHPGLYLFSYLLSYKRSFT